MGIPQSASALYLIRAHIHSPYHRIGKAYKYSADGSVSNRRGEAVSQETALRLRETKEAGMAPPARWPEEAAAGRLTWAAGAAEARGAATRWYAIWTRSHCE